MATSPTVRSRRLGTLIRRLRDEAEVSGATLASAIGASQTHLSSVESARRKLRKDQLEKLISYLEVKPELAEELRILRRDADQLGWWEPYSDVLPANIELLVGLETAASWIQVYDDAFVPALLQTPDYAGAVVSSAAPYQRSADMARIVEFRTARQQRLNDASFRLTCVVDEGALRRHVGGREVMIGQLNHLLTMDCAAEVQFHVLGFEAGEHPAQGETFSILTFEDPNDREAVYVDYTHSSAFLERPTEIKKHVSAFGAATAKALSVEESQGRIAKIMHELGG